MSYSVGLGLVPVPENRADGQKNNRTGPGIAKKSKSFLKPHPEPPENISEFYNQTRNREMIWISSRMEIGPASFVKSFLI